MPLDQYEAYVFPDNIEMPDLLSCWYWLFSQTAGHSSIGLPVVCHNSVELFHLEAAGQFSLQNIAGFSSYPQPVIDWKLCQALNSDARNN